MNKLIAALLLLAILPLPYAYYTLLRPIVCLGLIFLLIKDWQNLLPHNKAICVVIAVMFNPFSPIYLSKFVWVAIDLASALYLLKYETKITFIKNQNEK
jgi:hypothetical protein